MKIAVATFGNRISPRFDCAGAFYIVNLEDGRTLAEAEFKTSGFTTPDRIRLLVDQEVEALICGAIDEATAQQLGQCRMLLYSWISGTVEDSLRSLQRGELEPGMMMGAGGRCRGRWRMRRHQGAPRERRMTKEGGCTNAGRRQKRPRGRRAENR
jgi:predicted Fe-Mo cluster-binding NifX family protein